MRDGGSSLVIVATLLVLASSGAVAENDRGSSATGFWNQEYARGAPAEPAQPVIRHKAPTARILFGHRDSEFGHRDGEFAHRDGERRPRSVAIFPAAPPPPAPSGTVVAVFGDRLGRTMATGLQEGGAGPVRVVDATSEDAGLAAADFEVWLKSIRERLSTPDRISIAVMLIGANDRDPLHNGSESVDPGTPHWQALYEARIDAVAATFRAGHVPLIWVGLPAVRNDATSADFVRLNGLFRDRAARDGASFVDSWEAFLDDAGRYSPVGPDVEGDMVKLRKADGFSFTHAGARKLASFVAPDIKRLRPPPIVTGPEIARISLEKPREFDSALEIDVNAQIRREAGLPLAADPAASGSQTAVAAVSLPAKPAAGPVLPLTAPPLAPDGQLATVAAPAPGASSGLEASLVARTSLQTGPAAPKLGRADDFSWPRP